MTIPYQVTTENTPIDIQPIIDSTFAKVDAIYNKWNPDSELSQLNRFPAHTAFHCSTELYDLLKLCDQFVKISNGQFDPTIEPIQQLWKDAFLHNTQPSSEDIAHTMSAVGWHNLQIANNIVIKNQPNTALDLGAIAKGLAVDMLVKNLSAAGIQSIYVEWGGEVTTQGMHPQGRPWRVGIRSPTKPENFEHVIELQNASLATSGDYLQYWTVEHEGQSKTFFHVFDPHSGFPLEISKKSIASVTIQHPSCCIADAIATILLMAKDEKDAEEIFSSRITPVFPEASCWILSHHGTFHQCS
jgi:thiamine biosynthesis lipoprotein